MASCRVGWETFPLLCQEGSGDVESSTMPPCASDAGGSYPTFPPLTLDLLPFSSAVRQGKGQPLTRVKGFRTLFGRGSV